MSRRLSLLLAVLLVSSLLGFAKADEPAPEAKILRDLRYRDGASAMWRLDLALPAGDTSKPRPAIVVIHGGGWLEGDKSSFTFRKHGVPGNIEDLAALGFVAATINYRMSGEAPWPAALDDCRSAVRWLRAHSKEYGIDPKRVGAYGNSAGGHLALLLGMMPEPKVAMTELNPDESSRVQAVISDSGPIDLEAQYKQGVLREVVRRFMGGPPEGAHQDAYRQASPSSYVRKDIAPLLLIYGVSDEQVPVETADELVLDLGRAGAKDVSYQRLSFVDHCPYSLIRVPELRPVVDQFLLRTLMHPETAQEVRRRPK